MISNAIKVDMLIEFGHIYMDEEFGYEQNKSIKLLDDLVKEFKSKVKSFGYTVLVDDVNIKEKLWEMKDLIKELNNKAKLDFIGLEGNFSIIADIVINKIEEDKLKLEKFKDKRVFFYVDGNNKIALKTIMNDGKEKYTCVMLSLCWKLCNLGVYKYPKNSVYVEHNVMVGERIITILHSKYKVIEDKVNILLNNEYGIEYVKRVENIYFS
jgi:hypothetical protein